MKSWLPVICCFFWATAQAFASCSNTVYFLMVERRSEGPRDSFVLPLTRPEHIAYARECLSMGPGCTNRFLWVVARVKQGADGNNRDFLAVGAPQWSWHVTELITFAEQTAEGIQIRATDLENEIQYWNPDQEGGLAFAHKFLAEMLPPPCPSLSSVVTTNGLELTWTNLGVHYVYTVEVADSLDPPNWSPAPSGTWPTTATTWTDTSWPPSGMRFYRVRASFKVP